MIAPKIKYGLTDSLALEAMLRARGGDVPSPVNPNVSWSQAAWFVDPSNVTGLANDQNSGADAVHPLLTDHEIIRRWGTYSPTLNQDTQWTQMSDQPAGVDPVMPTPITINGHLFGIVGVLAQQGTAGVFAAVTAKNRATQTLLTVDLGRTPIQNSIIVNTDKGSFAWVDSIAAGPVAVLSQPLMNPTVPPTQYPPEDDTWAHGDHFVVMIPPKINLKRLTPFTPDSPAAGNAALGYLQDVWVTDPSGTPGQSQATIGVNVIAQRTRFDPAFVSDLSYTPGNVLISFVQTSVDGNNFQGGGSFGPIAINGGIVSTLSVAEGTSSTNSIGCQFDADVIFHGRWELGDTELGLAYLASDATVTTLLRCVGSTNYNPLSTPAFQPVIWGPGKLTVFSSSQFLWDPIYKAVDVIGNITGTVTLANFTTAFAFDETTGLWTLPRALTATNLDATIAGGGFAGVALRPNQSSAIGGGLTD